MKFAIIRDGEVINIVDAEPTETLTAAEVAVASYDGCMAVASDTAAVGHIWDGAALTPPAVASREPKASGYDLICQLSKEEYAAMQAKEPRRLGRLTARPTPAPITNSVIVALAAAAGITPQAWFARLT